MAQRGYRHCKSSSHSLKRRNYTDGLFFYGSGKLVLSGMDVVENTIYLDQGYTVAVLANMDGVCMPVYTFIRGTLSR